jgi:hypothetical protein
MRCREGSYARWPVLYGRYERYFFDRSIPAKASSFLEGNSLVHTTPITSLLFSALLQPSFLLVKPKIDPDAFESLRRMNSPQTPSMFRALGDALYVLSDESSLRKRAHSPAGDEPTPTRGLLVSVVNLSAATRSKTFCKKRTTIISERTIAKPN